MSLRVRFKESIGRDWPSYCVILLAACIQLFLVSRSVDFLITNILPDDAFYYFQIARNATQGYGASFDGVELTNGFHPLWLIILLPIFHLFSVGGTHDLTPITTALYLSVAFNLITAVLVLRLVSRVTQSKWIKAFGLVVWALNPFLLFAGINGLETSLALLLTGLFFLLAIEKVEQRSVYWDVGIGVSAGFMILARLDLAVYLAVFLVWILLRDGVTRVVFVRTFRIGLIATAIALPWFIWNWFNFGMLLTSAANVNSMVTRELIAQDNGTSLFQTLKGVIYVLDHQVRLLFLSLGVPAFVLGVMGAGAALLSSGTFVLPRRLKETTAVHALFVGFLALFLLNVVGRLVGRSWYFVSVEFFVVMACTAVLAVILGHVRRPHVLMGVTLAFVLFSFLVSWSKHVRGQHIAQLEMYAAAVWGNDNLPQGTTIGSFNSGIQGYFSEHRVINIDGLVNNAAYIAMRERKLWAYLEAQEVDYVIDFEIYLDYRYRGFMGESEYMQQLKQAASVAVAPHARSAKGISVYEFPKAEN